MKLEKLTVDDTIELTSLLHQAYETDEKIGIHFNASNISSTEVKKHLRSTPTFGYRDTEGNLITTISVRLAWSLNPGPYFLPHLGWLATDSKYKHQGYAKKILNAVVIEFIQKELKAPAVTLGTALEHPWLKELYISLGFVPFKEIQKYKNHKTIYLINVFDNETNINGSEKYLKEFLQNK